MIIFGIDPGPQASAWILFDSKSKEILGHAHETNALVHERLDDPISVEWVIESVTGYGKQVGAEVFATCEAIGAFSYHLEKRGHTLQRISRPDIKLTLCESRSAKPKDISAALYARWGGEAKAKGTKRAPGPLYGLNEHERSALAVAVAYAEQKAWEARINAGAQAFAVTEK